MQSGRYLFGIVFFFVFLTALILLVIPVQMYNAKVTSYYTVPPNENIHYTQVLEYTNTSACIILDNTGGRCSDQINISFRVSIYADIEFSGDTELDYRDWDQNFTILKGEIKIIKLYFNATYPGSNTRKLYIQIAWGQDLTSENSARLAELYVGSVFELESLWTMKNMLVIAMALGLGIILFVITTALKRDFRRYKRRLIRPRARPRTYETAPPTPTPPPPHVPPSMAAPAPAPPPAGPPTAPPAPPPTAPPSEPLAVETIELVPCPKCGSKIDKTQIICSNCGYELPKCVICNLIIEDDDEIETCPSCGAIGHRAHFREWARIKGICPICKQNINFA